MTSSPFASVRRTSVAAVAAGVAALLLLPASAANAASAPAIDVRASEIGDARPSSDAGWWSDLTNASIAVDTSGPQGDPALALNLVDTTSRAYVYHSFAADERPTDIEPLRSGASYTFSGTNVNFQFELVFRPDDPSFGPNPANPSAPGDNYCDSANAWGFTDVPSTWCYTVVKWEPLTAGSGWTTVDLTADTAVDSSTGTAGWRTQKRIGTWPKAGAFANSGTFSEYFAQIAEYEVTAVVVGAGSGTPGPVTGHVKNITVGGASYDFALEPAPPAAPPAADSDELETLIHDQGIDVAGDTERFVTVGTVNSDLSRVDATRPVSGIYENWQGADAFADVYSYSTATFVGTFPVVDGDVQMAGADLSHLEPGVHHLLFRGQTTGTIAIVQLTVLGSDAGGDDELAATGTWSGALGLGAVSVLSLALGVASLIIGRRQAARRAI